jgi:hypothetical protein
MSGYLNCLFTTVVIIRSWPVHPACQLLFVRVTRLQNDRTVKIGWFEIEFFKIAHGFPEPAAKDYMAVPGLAVTGHIVIKRE